MDEQPPAPGSPLTRREISAALTDCGWRLILGSARTQVRVGSLARAAAVTDRVISAAGPPAETAAGPRAETAVGAVADDASDSLQVDIRARQVVITLYSWRAALIGRREVELARRISAAVRELGLATDPDIGTQTAPGSRAHRSAQVLEIAIDATDIAAIRPFWRAVLGYTDEPGKFGPEDALVDPAGQQPAVWFQQMDAPRPQRNRIHFDVSVPHDEAQHRIRAALAAGGTLLSDAEAPAFWVLADAEGNEACVTTWQGRDPA